MAKFVFSAFADEAGSSLDEQIAALSRNGIGYIEPRMIDGKSFLTLSEKALADMRKKLDDAGIRVYSLGSPIGKYPIHEDFEIHKADFRKALRAAEILGASRMRIFSFFVGQEELGACREEVLSRMRYLLDEAKKAGVVLCHENESLIYGQMPHEVEDLLTSLPDLKSVYDAANFVMNDADAAEGMRATLPSLDYMHIKDASYKEKIILPAGEGDGDIAKRLLEIDAAREGTVTLTLEPHLKLFDGFAAIDKHTLAGRYTFANATESFDFAVKSLEKVLTSIGFRKGDNKEWTR